MMLSQFPGVNSKWIFFLSGSHNLIRFEFGTDGVFLFNWKDKKQAIIVLVNNFFLWSFFFIYGHYFLGLSIFFCWSWLQEGNGG